MHQLTPDQQRQVAAEIRAGRMIQAIKLYRECTGVGLKEAKDAVEAMDPDAPPADLTPGTQSVFPASTAGTAGVDATTRRQLAAMVQAGRKIEAIKTWREKTGDSLAEAKARVEQLATEPQRFNSLEQRAAMQSKGGCLGVILIAAMLAAAVTLTI